MRTAVSVSVCAALIAVNPASAAAPEVRYGPAPAWVLPPARPTATPAPAEAPLQFLYADTQVRIASDGQHNYNAYRVRLLKPEALPLGNISIPWSPSTGEATIHRVNIIRDGTVIDVLKDARFQVIQREGGLERSMLDGELTAFLQVPGLRIGDELEFAATVRHRDPTLGDHAFGLFQFPLTEGPGVFRFQLSWPEKVKMTWRGTRDLPQPPVSRADGLSTIAFEMRDPNSAILNEGAPARFNVRRLIEYSDFASWTEVSQRFAPLFEAGSVLAASSPLKAEATKISRTASDPRTRMLAALRLVENEVRYVYVGLGGGNYRPATVDETWARRFGDCKAKTVLLLALLRELGIKAEAVLVNPAGDDGLDARLPNPGLFNHALVRATLGADSVWLDGTRFGDLTLEALPPPTFRWALPLRQDGAKLEAVAPNELKRPDFINVVDIDASAGITTSATVKAEQVLRQDQAIALRSQLSALSQQDTDRALRQFWRGEMDWVEADSVSWRYDVTSATLVLSLLGHGKPHWDDRSLLIADAGFVAPNMLKRAKEQDQSAPWLTYFPFYRCWATTVRLPPAGANRHWALFAPPMDLRLGGVAYWRSGGISGGLARTVISRHTLVPEISAGEAQQLNAELPAFNNKMSRIWESEGETDAAATTLPEPMPFDDGVNWATSDSACARPPSAR